MMKFEALHPVVTDIDNIYIYIYQGSRKEIRSTVCTL